MTEETTRQRLSTAAKVRWPDPVEREKLLAALAAPERREKISAAAKAAWADPVKREKMMNAISAARGRRKGG